MAVYVDRAKVQFRGREWCHLMADTLEELHAFAQRLMRVCFIVQHLIHIMILLWKCGFWSEHGAIDADRRTIIACGKRLKLQLGY